MIFKEFTNAGYRITRIFNEKIEITAIDNDQFVDVNTPGVETLFCVDCEISNVTNTDKSHVHLMVDLDFTKYRISSPSLHERITLNKTCIKTLKSAIESKISSDKLKV